eukprot:200117_1
MACLLMRNPMIVLTNILYALPTINDAFDHIDWNISHTKHVWFLFYVLLVSIHVLDVWFRAFALYKWQFITDGSNKNCVFTNNTRSFVLNLHWKVHDAASRAMRYCIVKSIPLVVI